MENQAINPEEVTNPAGQERVNPQGTPEAAAEMILEALK